MRHEAKEDVLSELFKNFILYDAFVLERWKEVKNQDDQLLSKHELKRPSATQGIVNADGRLQGPLMQVEGRLCNDNWLE